METAGSQTNGSPDETLIAGPLEVRLDQRTVLADGRAIVLTVREFHLLAVLASHPEQVISREEIYNLVWAGSMPAHDRSVDVYISKLRHKLEASMPHWSFIQTHIGFGYSFSPKSLVR